MKELAPNQAEEHLPFGEEIGSVVGVDSDLPFGAEIPGSGVWVEAPDTSHVHSFRLNAATETEGPTIEMKFKPTATQPLRHYKYSFTQEQNQQAATIWEELQGVAHPGIVLWHWLIRGGVPYQEL